MTFGERRTPLRRRTRIKPRSEKTEALAVERRAFVERILGERPRCEWSGCRRPSFDVHERKTRARSGGVRSKLTRGGVLDPENVVALCREHHDWIHRNPEEAHRLGYLRHSWES